MTGSPLVSIITPCYNAEKYIEMSIRSLMNQTYKNIEIIIIDDCSTDSTWDILQILSCSDSRIVLERNERNLKIVKTLNKLISKARGKYIARMDADDISAPDRIEKQVRFLEDNSEFGLCGTNAWRIDANNRIMGRSLLPTENDDIQIAVNYFCPFYHPSMMIKAGLLKENLYREDCLYAEDLELWQRLIKIAKGKNLDEMLFYYRIINTSLSEDPDTASVQKELTCKLCHEIDFNKLMIIKNKLFVGMTLWSKIKQNTDLKKYLTIRMKVCILRYLLFRMYECLKYVLKKNFFRG